MGNLLYDTLSGRRVARAPSVPKIWLDLACNLLEREYLHMFSDPEYAALTVVEAAVLCRCDGARVFLYPRKDVRIGEDGVYRHFNGSTCLGKVDIAGGWATQFEDPGQIDLTDAQTIINYSFFRSPHPIIKGIEELERIRLPKLNEYHELYDQIVQHAVEAAQGKLCPIGDCNSGTLAFCVSLLGMSGALLAMVDEPAFVHSLMDIGTELSITQAKFFIDQGIRVLRYNDSPANMKVISPQMWREYIGPRIRLFCEEVHKYCPEARVYCHICGNIMPVLEDLCGSGLDCIGLLDPLGCEPVWKIRQMVGEQVNLMGGVNTLSFIEKTPEKVREEARFCIQGGFRQGHYVIGSGCVIPRAASKESIEALRLASEDMEEESIGETIVGSSRPYGYTADRR